MKRVVLIALLVFVAVAGWRVGGGLSSDAVSMAVGVFFGVLAGIPTALLVMAGSRRREGVGDAGSASPAGRQNLPYVPSPPVIVVTPQAPGAAPQWPPNPGAATDVGMWGQTLSGRERRFKVVGEEETWLDDWQ